MNMNISVQTEAFNISNFLNDSADAMSPSTQEHRAVLVPKAFVKGLVDNFNREIEKQQKALLKTEEPVSIQIQAAQIEPVIPVTPVMPSMPVMPSINNIVVEEEVEETDTDETTETGDVKTIWGQFDNPFAIVSELEHTMKSLANVVGVLNEQRHTLDMFSKELFSKEASLSNRDKLVSDKERALRNEEHELNTRSSAITEKEISLAMKSKNLDSYEKQLNNDKLAIAERVANLQKESIKLDNKLFELTERAKSLDAKEEKLEKYKNEQENLIRLKFAEMNRAKDAMESMITSFIGDISNKDSGIVALSTKNEKAVELTYAA